MVGRHSASDGKVSMSLSATSLSGKRVVILGGTSGIGLATAIGGAAAGADVVVVSRRDSSVQAALAELPASAAGQAFDLTDHTALAAFFANLGRFDHLIFTAGENLAFSALADYDADLARQLFELRFFTAIQAAHLAVPLLNEGGSITFTSGSAALRPVANWALGAATMSAVIAAAQALAIELAPIRVNTVVPGMVRTPLWASMPNDEQESLYASVAASLPAKRVAEAADVAKAYLSILDNDYLTGTTSVVDGGGLLV
jgi:NAD(P)-dependent dehydrogenase (short-subunit alcohol dehydrogenase family)